MFKKLTRLWISLCAIFFMLAPNIAQAKIKTYTRMSGNYYIDFCHGISPCGREVAIAFCKSRGHSGMAGWVKSKTTSKRVKYPHTGQKCTNPFGCNHFTYIKCLDNYKQAIFYYPSIKGGIKIDYCFHGNTGCGKLSADRICQDKGYNKSFAFKKTRNLKRTFYMGNRKFCDDKKNGPFKTCNAFEFVRCVK